MTEWTTIQNVVFSTDNDPDVLPLYADPETWAKFGDRPVRVSERSHIDEIVGRTSMRIDAGARVSFASYFNAFPASYWQHYTNVSRLRLLVDMRGACTVLVYRSNAQGIAQHVESQSLDGDATATFDLPLATFGDGGWYWFDVIAHSESATLLGGRWETADPEITPGLVSLGITTFNKPDYCVETLDTIASDPGVVDVIDRIFLVDQGTQKVADQDGYPEVAEKLGERLRIITQNNLGGSGGFARSMAETLDRPDSDFVLLVDDDVKIEPESILRAVHFARHSRRPTIVGGHMFDLLDRPVLHAFAEVVDPEPFIWKATVKEDVPHDFRVSNLRQTRWMHSRMDSDYNGWWFCLIPTKVIREIGLALPVFIKWDDAEYSLRAREHGFPTVSLPGAALWHVSWLDKDDTIDWQAYYHARNRFVAALLHSDYPRGGKLLRDSRRWDLKHLLGMQYYPITLRHMALNDVLRGPAHLHETMPTKLGELRSLAGEFREKRVFKTDGELPHANRGKQFYPVPSGTQQSKGPTGLPLILYTARMLARHWLTKPAPANVENPEVELAKRDATWFRTPGFDSALVTTADGSGKSWFARDRGEFRRMLRQSNRLHRRLGREWATLAKEYREALPEYTSVQEWRKTFER
ncbi:glycosyl transferase [Agromyces sp. Root81]|uniref:glycosyltransferase n=1 Tax=Agromyces sp. Root81 TaxID=1736601 RepID=UPI0006F2EFC2|nr:glycosyltransferase [Agromyces sp. Root81]KRC60462.1 glycosyl transferase [Agromyces sp. Root81]